MEIWVIALTVWWWYLYLQGRVRLTSSFQHAKPVWILRIVWLLYLLCSLLPLPSGLVAVLSGKAASLYALASTDSTLIPLAVDYFASSDFFLRSVSLVLMFFLALVLLKRSWRIKLFIRVIVLSAVFQAVYGGLMTLSGVEYGFFIEKEAYRGLATGTFINRNHLAGYLEMALALGIGLLMASMGGEGALNWRQRMRNLAQLLLSRKIRLRLYLAIMVIGLVLTHSRMGNTAFFSSLLIAGGIWLLLSQRKPKRSTIILLASLLVIDIFIVGNWFGIDKVVERLEKTSAQTETRDEVVQHGLTYSQDYLLAGSGGGSFYAVFPGYRQGDIRGQYDHAHNDYLQFLVETGVIGVVLLGGVVMFSLLSALRAIKTRRDPLLRGLGFSGVMGITALLIHSSVDFNLQIPANAAMFMLLLAVSWTAIGHRAPKQV
jgi:O-antigen ligase